MDNAHLTRKQHEFFTYIVEYKKEHEVWPTYREIADYFGYASPNSVTQNIQALLKKGYLIKRDDEEYDLPSEKKSLLGETEDKEGIPVRGLIAAGSLQEAVEANLGSITLETLFPDLDDLFALRVTGFSMKDVGIQDGDFV
ncbi:MAG: repressor LexA, partial [Gracilimonas sp.]|nr:repressor LexA [Gracilimonas sp.]